MTELAIPRAPRSVGSDTGIRFAGKSLEALLAEVAAGIAGELRRDVDIAVVVRHRYGAMVWGWVRRPRLGVAPAATPAHDRVVGSALGDGRPTHTARLIGVPLENSGRIVGAVLVTATGSRSLDATDWTQSRRAASRWAVTVDNVIAFAAASDRAANLEIALAGRAVIEQAKGILIEREGCDADGAFGILRELSQHGDVKLSAVAARIVADAQAD